MMGKNTVETDTDIASDDVEFEGFEDEEFDFEEIFPPAEVPSRKRSRRAKNARRLIEQYWEDRKLAQQLDEYYLHPDG